MPTVFVVSSSGHDFSDARRFGELVVLSAGKVDKYQLTAMLREFEPKLCKSTSNDYMLLSGPTVMNAVACSMFAALHGRLNLLLFHGDGGRQHYIERRIELNHE